MLKKNKIAIIGGGVAGSTSAIHLAQLGLEVTLFEKESSLISGPPFCHLHAGGNLYREISNKQCITLLKQSIDFAKFYPFIVDYRPTVIALPITDKQSPNNLIERLELLKKEYQSLIEDDPLNNILGKSDNYYKLYTREKIEQLKQYSTVTKPSTSDEWIIPLAHHLDLNKIQFPLILVQEYGLNLFRLASGVTLTLQKMNNVTLKTKTEITNIIKEQKGWRVEFNNQYDNFDYIINASGFRTGKIDDMIGVPCKRMVEFKSAYVSYWEEESETIFPELIVHGERGTPQGMGQFTPYPNGYFQLHGMTNDITLYSDGLVANTPQSCQPELKKDFMKKIEVSWSKEETYQRTNSAIKHLSKFIPMFSKATVASKPLFGAQQIPGDDPTLRVAEVSFPTKGYARCEIVKVSSVIDMVDSITKDLIELNLLEKKSQVEISLSFLENLEENRVQEYAKEIAKERGYPASLAQRNIINQL